MYGASGYCVPTHSLMNSLFSNNAVPQQQHTIQMEQQPINHGIAFGHSKQHYCNATACHQEVDVSLDLMQYMSESLDQAWAASTSPACQQQQQQVPQHKGSFFDTCPSLMGSRCSTHSNQSVPDTCRQHHQQHQQQQQQVAASSSSECTISNSCDSDALAAGDRARRISSSGSGSSAMTAEPGSPTMTVPSSCQAYDDDFVWQCYYGDPKSAANQQQQRPKRPSPFAALATFPGFPTW